MEPYIIPNLNKACGLLNFLSDHPDGVTMVEIEKELSLPKTTAFRILRTFCACDMANKKGHLYFPGSALIHAGLQSLHGNQLREKGIPILQELTRQTRQTSHIAIPCDYRSLILEVCDSPNPVLVASRPGALVDLYCSSTGKVFLAYLFADRLDEVLAEGSLTGRTENTITDRDKIRYHIEMILKQGYAVDDEEYHIGVRCLASPVRDMQNQVVAAVGITGPAAEVTRDAVAALADTVMQSASQLSKLLGYSAKKTRGVS